MSITKNLNFTKSQLRAFARVFRNARLTAGLTQLQVAQEAFEYEVSHCKVSRVERGVMAKVDAHCLERMAGVVGLPRDILKAIDPKFDARASVVRAATKKGFWNQATA